MSQTVLITGSSTGIGKATAQLFAQRGWNVIATLRSPEKEADLKAGDKLLLAKLDVTDPASIKTAIASGIQRFGRIDALVNNAGYALSGTFESTTQAQVRRQFDTNVFGLMEVARQVIPHFRANRAGTLINVASMGGRLTFPLYSVYHATKWAVDGFSESLAFELEPLGIHVRIVEPGAIKTDFYTRSADFVHDRALEDYNFYVDKALHKMNQAGARGAPPAAVAKTIYQAATDRSNRLRYVVGPDAKGLLTLRRFLSDGAYRQLIRKAIA